MTEDVNGGIDVEAICRELGFLSHALHEDNYASASGCIDRAITALRREADANRALLIEMGASRLYHGDDRDAGVTLVRIPLPLYERIHAALGEGVEGGKR